ncbi:MAG TPA: single-stranded DNA-binding protein [Mycobacteriales bacterium]|jgi:single-strand DNA-binding protein|nr:single-stranded DNA-binding protein [Mycobacteriales bacterium]HVX68061.1 single-stranded DNA-binding protein [Mycobacteriales bacterium]
MAATAAAGTRAAPEHRNDVFVTGRLSTYADERELPSGDQVVTWRLIVDRPSDGGRAGIDAIDCVTFGARLRRAAVKWQPGEIIEVEGALRRRFWRSSAGTASRFEVEVSRAARRR